MHWLRHDALALAGPDLATRRELFDFIVAELATREPEGTQRIRPVRVALQNQRDTLLAFAGVLDAKGSVKNLGRYGASWIAWWPKRPSSTAALT